MADVIRQYILSLQTLYVFSLNFAAIQKEQKFSPEGGRNKNLF